MPFLGSTCVDHGQGSTDPAAQCCPGYQKWAYDANTGLAYNGFKCWTATCANEGQYAPPSGVGSPGCCSPLVNTGGKCAQPTSGGGGGTNPCVTMGHVPLLGQTCCLGLTLDSLGICNIQQQSTSIIPGVDNMILYAGAGLLVLMMFTGKKK